MKRIILLTLLMLAAKMTLAQAVQFSQPIQTSGPNVPTSGGALPQTLWVANAKVVVCAHVTPASMQTYVNCLATPITTYTDSSMATSCPLSPTIAQMVELPGIACTASSGVASTVSFWAVSGTYDYYVISSYGTFGPYNISQGGGGGGGGVPSCSIGQMTYYNLTGQVQACLNVGSGLSLAGGVLTSTGSGVTSVSVATANGMQGSATSGATPVITIGPDSTHLIPHNTGTNTNYLNEAGGYTQPTGAIPSLNSLNGALSILGTSCVNVTSVVSSIYIYNVCPGIDISITGFGALADALYVSKGIQGNYVNTGSANLQSFGSFSPSSVGKYVVFQNGNRGGGWPFFAAIPGEAQNVAKIIAYVDASDVTLDKTSIATGQADMWLGTDNVTAFNACETFVSNGGGGRCAVPPGNYLMATAPYYTKDFVSQDDGSYGTTVGGSGAVVTATVTGGFITGYTVSNGGSGYTASAQLQMTFTGGCPAVSLGPCGQAYALANTNSSGQVSTITPVYGGYGYTTAPTVHVTSLGGDGATAGCTLSSGTCGTPTITSGGSGYQASLSGGIPFVAVNTSISACTAIHYQWYSAPAIVGKGTASTNSAGVITSATWTTAPSGCEVAPNIIFGDFSCWDSGTSSFTAQCTNLTPLQPSALPIQVVTQPGVSIYGTGGGFGSGSNLIGPWDGAAVDTVTAGMELVQSAMFGGQIASSDISGLFITNSFIGIAGTDNVNYSSIHDIQFKLDGLPLLTDSMDNGFTLYNVYFNNDHGSFINGGTWQHRTDAQYGTGGFSAPESIGSMYVISQGVNSALDDFFAAEFWHPEFSANAPAFPETCAFPQTPNQRQTSSSLSQSINPGNWMCYKGATGFGWENLSRDDFSIPDAWPVTGMYANSLARPMFYGAVGPNTFTDYNCEDCNSITTDPYRAEAKQEGLIEYVHSTVFGQQKFDGLEYDYNNIGSGTITQEIYDISAGGFPSSADWDRIYAAYIVYPLPPVNFNFYYAYNLAPASGGPDCLQVATTGAITNTGSPCGGSGTFTALSGDATSTATGGATTVVGIEGHAIAAPSTAAYIHWSGSAWEYLNPSGAGTVTTSGSPVSPNVACYSAASVITNCTSANVQTAIGAGVYDASGAAAARQANLSLVAGTYANGNMCTYASSGTLLNCNTTIPSIGTWGALNYPTWVSGTPFVKMTAAGTFALDTSTYLTASGISGMTAGQVPIAATASTVTSSKAIQGTDTSLMSSGTISGTSVLLCTDANGGATTSSCPAGGSGVVTAAAQYDVPYYTQAGSTAQVGGAAIAGFQYDSTGGAPAAATQGNLGTLINVTSGQALISGGSGSAVTGKALAGSGAGLTTGPTTAVSGDVITASGTGGQIADSGTLLTALAPLASPAFTGTPTFASGYTSVTAGTGAVGSATKWFSNIYLGNATNYVNLTPATPSGSYALTIPAIAGADTLATLGLAQTFSGLNTYSAGINLSGASSPLQLAGSAGTTGQVLQSAGAGATPTWAAAGGGCSNNCTISSTAVGTVPLTVAGFSSGQTADLLDIYDYATHNKLLWVTAVGDFHPNNIYMAGNQFNVYNASGLHFWQGGGGDYTGTNPFIDVMNAYGIFAASATANPVTMQIGGYLEYTGTMTTGSWTQFALIGKLGNSSSTNVYNSTVPMEELKLSPTINVSTSSTGYYCEICSLPTETSVGAGVTNYFIKHAASGGSLGTPNYAVTEGGFESVVGTQSVGTKFTTTGCSISSTTGGATVGKFTLGANSCSAVITMNGATGLTASNGWSCHANDETTAAGNTLLYFSANSATTATLSVPATAGTTDVIDFACSAY